MEDKTSGTYIRRDANKLAHKAEAALDFHGVVGHVAYDEPDRWVFVKAQRQVDCFVDFLLRVVHRVGSGLRDVLGSMCEKCSIENRLGARLHGREGARISLYVVPKTDAQIFPCHR